MKDKENTATNPRKKKLIYSIVVAVCALLLITATVLTVYFVTTNNNTLSEEPPIDEGGKKPNDGNEGGEGEQPGGEEDPNKKPDDQPSGGETPAGPDDNKPAGGEKTAFIKPLSSCACSLEYNVIYHNTSLDRWYKHPAVDFAAEEGESVFSMADGVVKEVSMEEVLGNYIVVEHEGGITATYRFVEPVENLKAGDTVTQGQVIATVAAAYGTEYKDGTHLHLEMHKDGERVDPMDFIDSTLEEK